MCRKATIIRSRIAEVAIINNEESNEYLNKVAAYMAELELKLFTSSQKTIVPLSVHKRKFRETTPKQEQRKPVIQYDLNMNELNRYPSMGSVPNATPSCVSKVCKGITRKHKGFIYRYEKPEAATGTLVVV